MQVELIVVASVSFRASTPRQSYVCITFYVSKIHDTRTCAILVRTSLGAFHARTIRFDVHRDVGTYIYMYMLVHKTPRVQHVNGTYHRAACSER